MSKADRETWKAALVFFGLWGMALAMALGYGCATRKRTTARVSVPFPALRYTVPREPVYTNPPPTGDVDFVYDPADTNLFHDLQMSTDLVHWVTVEADFYGAVSAVSNNPWRYTVTNRGGGPYFYRMKGHPLP